MTKVGNAEKVQAWSSAKDDGLGPGWKFWRRRRYIITILAALGFAHIYALRVNLSVAIVDMTSARNVTLANGTTIQVAEFNWDSRQVGFLLSSFFYGYFATQVIGGWASQRFGSNVLFFYSVAATAILTLFTPVAAKLSYTLLVIIRIVEGMFEGVVFPCVHGLWTTWAPPLEVSKLSTAAFGGVYLGTVIALPATGLIAKSVGWEPVFYIFGAMSIVWCTAWAIIARRAPRDDPRISKQELDFIERSIGHPSLEVIPTPWRAIFLSPAIWAINVTHMTEAWGFFVLITSLPIYLHNTLKFDLAETGILSALPYLGMGVVMVTSGQLADWLRPKILSTTAVRKIYGCGSFFIQIVLLIIISCVHSKTAKVVLIIGTVSAAGLAWSSVLINQLDVAPMHAAVLMGLSNSCAVLSGIIGPYVTGFLIQHDSNQEWNMVFYIICIFNAIGMVVYFIWGTGEVQPWAMHKPNDEENSKEIHKKGGAENIAFEKDNLNEGGVTPDEQRRERTFRDESMTY